ncbi:MAG: MBOAT family protein [Pelagibacterales bacterium]|nr:MBOAT family protein [Pelagibacterales bacterium]
MVFSSNIFLFAFLPLVMISYFLLPEKLVGKNYKNSLLLVASLFFYAWGEMHYLWLLMLSIIGNYAFGIAIEKVFTSFGFKSQNDKKVLSKTIIILAVIFNLVLLCYFKYANFLAENINLIFGLEIANKKINLPIGISFFTFHAISYLVDIYRGKCKAQKNIFDLSLYIAFFPQLIAGPIVRYNFVEKYLTKRRHNSFFIAYGVRRFVIGFIKKVLIANPLGEVADVVFSSPTSDLNSPIAWIGIICYTLQIYFDFSGYSDMAVGLARIFGFKFPENFNYPYISKSIKEFWRRWHMSLSAWFRDYVYIPLGGNRVSQARQYFNLVIVFFLCGLWHGSSWNFIVWGLFHGLFLVLERLLEGYNFSVIFGRKQRLPSQQLGFSTLGILKIISGYIYTILVIIVGWVFFRSSDLSYSVNFLQVMFSNSYEVNFSSDLLRLLNSHIIWASFTAAILGFSPFVRNCCLKLIRKNKIFVLFFDIVLILLFVAAIIQLSATTHNPFIYFQF